MSKEPISKRAAEHVAAFNQSVRSGDWATFADRFTPDATMRFVGVPVGPFTGREAIAAGYAAQPPSDTLAVNRAVFSGDVDELWFTWHNGGTGTMTLHWNAGLIAELTITFTWPPLPLLWSPPGRYARLARLWLKQPQLPGAGLDPPERPVTAS